MPLTARCTRRDVPGKRDGSTTSPTTQDDSGGQSELPPASVTSVNTAQAAPTGSGSIPTDTVAPDDALSTSELSATAAEISSLSTDEQADQALDTLLRLASLDFDTDDIRSLADALLAAQGADSGQVVDPIFGVTPSLRRRTARTSRTSSMAGHPSDTGGSPQ